MSASRVNINNEYSGKDFMDKLEQAYMALKDNNLFDECLKKSIETIKISLKKDLKPHLIKKIVLKILWNTATKERN